MLIAPTNACVKHLKSLVKAPIIRIRKLPTLDNLIMELTRVRMDTLRCGGERGLAIQGDTADSVRPWMTVVLSRYAVALQGRQVPSIGSFILPEDMPQTKSPVAAKGKKGRRARKAGASLPPPPTPSASTGSGSDALNSLVSKLADATDPAEKRRLRKALRKLGHRGGARSTKGTE